MCAAAITLALEIAVPVAEAQLPQYPAVSLSTCIRLEAAVRNGQPVLRFGEDVVLSGPAGCGVVGERLRLILESTPVVIGETIVAEDGSFRIEAQLPPEIAPGTHRLVVDQGGKNQIVRPVEIVSAMPASVRTSSTTARSPMATVMWTILLLAGLSVIVLFAWRHFAAPVRARRRPGGNADGADLQRIDTTRFVPLRRERPQPTEKSPEATAETWD